MLHKLITSLDRFLPIEETQAHCDIPCKIYDPSTAIIACLSLIRMIELIEDFQDAEKTLQDKAVDKVMAKVRQGLENELGAELR
ncbi:MAG: hypothetical protein HRT88_23845 [Lentisphaeraceae bacterium]|nr:hypothetical protein [Lentisphaeraceae bacterium]